MAAAATLDLVSAFLTVDEVLAELESIAKGSRAKRRHLYVDVAGDRAWRLRIDAWPALASADSYSRYDWRRIVSRADELGLEVVPVFAAPGGMTAGLKGYPELGVTKGALDTRQLLTFRFLDDVVRELAIATPGPAIGVRLTSAARLSSVALAGFRERLAEIAERNGKQLFDAL